MINDSRPGGGKSIMSGKGYKAKQIVTLLQEIELNVAKGETGAFQSKSDTGRG